MDEQMSLDALMSRLLEICPNGEIGEDNDGQIIFYTNKRLTGEKGLWMTEEIE